MDLLISLYERLKKLREAGVRMKDIAEETEIASSVLSSLYSTVIPTYIQLISAGNDSEKALEEALQQVNNLSKRKLMGLLDELHSKVMAIDPRVAITNTNRPLLDDIEKEAGRNVQNVNCYAGLYLGYSRSSYKDGLKVEPYMIRSISEGETMPKVYCQNLAGDYYTGTGLFSSNQIGYLFFNEQKRLQFTLKVIYLQLPMLPYPNQLKGLYMTHDYNRNPIARRLLLVRIGDEIPLEEFANLREEVILHDEITEEQQVYYDYTCQDDDVVRSFMIISPDKGDDDLVLEKKILKLL